MSREPLETLLKTQRVARALGVSVSTIKRWVDAGVLPARRTPGGHRLIPLAEALQFARREGLPQAKLEMLAEAGDAQFDAIDDRVREALERALTEGRAADARALVLSVSASGIDAANLGDHLIRPVMERIGHGWQFGSLDVFEEHRASHILGSALTELIQGLPRPRGGAPLALGATPEGDLYTLSGLLCELLLRELGWDAINLGANLPLRSLARAVARHRPRLVWLSVHHLADPAAFLRDYEAFYATASRTGAAVILGGRALGPELRARLMAAGFGDRLAHLAEFARGVHPRPEPRPEETAERPDSTYPRTT